VIDRYRKSESAEEDSSPAMLLSSGYIAGGAIAAVLISFMNFKPQLVSMLDAKATSWFPASLHDRMDISMMSFVLLAFILLVVGLGWFSKSPERRS
jgi:hypothetical protein